MTDVAAQLKTEVLKLSEADRLELALDLWESLADPDEDCHLDEKALIDELERRSADLDAGRATAQPYREAIDELRQEALRESRAR